MKPVKHNSEYQELVQQISHVYVQGREQAALALHDHLLKTYWQVGCHIVEFELKGKTRAAYGESLIKNLARDLMHMHGRGFSLSNIKRMRQFYQANPIAAEIPPQLSWTHWVELLKIEDPLERSFYTKQSMLENWSSAELIRQKKTSLYLRLAATRNRDEILKLSKHGLTVEKPADLIREPYVLDFLQIPEPYQLNESEIEEKIIDKLQDFLLELGKGFAFIGRQYRITLGNRHHHVDLVFYNRILKCFVLIDLKREESGYEDVGQMNMYLGYFENEENTEGDNPPIGIVLAREKDELVVKYAMHNLNSRLFVSRYQLYLPNREELTQLIQKQLASGEGTDSATKNKTQKTT